MSNESIELVPVRPEYRDALARICYEAFATFQQRHGFEPDFPNVEVARGLMELFSDTKRFRGFAAVLEGRPVGSNFLAVFDGNGAAGGVGPITVDPNVQARGIGKRLMQAVIDQAKRDGVRQVRLMQDAHNQASMSLYSSLGFDWREAAAMMQIPSDKGPQPGVRPMTRNDLPAVTRMAEARYHVPRGGEVAWALERALNPVVRERGGRIVGYFTPSMLGHGVAETVDDAIAMILHAGSTTPPPIARFFCPLGEHALHRAAMKAGCRALKVMNLMTTGEYHRPNSVWMPSIMF